MSNAFIRHGIDHLSASALNCWRAAPGVWALRYLAKISDKGNAAMWRGTAVEQGFAALLRSKDMNTAFAVAHTSYDLNAAGEITDEIEAERELIEPMIRQCMHWQPPSDLNAAQLRIEHWFDDIPIPVVGYLDLAFDGIDIDLKSTKACPSAPRPDHIRQVSLYRAARGRAGGVLYVTNKRHAYFGIDDDTMERALGDLQADALSLRNFLARCDSRQDALRSLPVDWDGWQAPKTKVLLSEILLAG
jgi:hypothetical protein